MDFAVIAGTMLWGAASAVFLQRGTKWGFAIGTLILVAGAAVAVWVLVLT